ncbi:MAG TPA: beta-L-arabinofuranosidase domain-containing protein [Gammaproteobacteria bacterium]|nr:beta-L-arabinofuranosidase domain-containing protein [Gammaproteobacteria bacterium]
MTDPVRRELLQALASMPALGAFAPAIFAQDQAKPQRRSLIPFELSEVRLLRGPFETAQQLDARYLSALDPDRMLHNFRVNAGLKPRAPVYGGWESQEPWVDIRCHGHTLGHYLSACAMMYAATKTREFGRRVDYIVAELAACQQARGDGLVCAFPDGAAQLENSLSGKPFIGVPWYTMHKLMAGLRDARYYAGNAQALPVLTGLADWIVNSSRGLDDVQFQKMLGTEHGGMNEVLGDLYAVSGDPKYLALAERFNHQALLQPLAEGRDTLDGLHSNTQIPKVTGFARLHGLTGKEAYGRAARCFWRTVVEGRSFATGGNGDREHFFPASEFRRHLQSAKTMETCCTHNMLRLTRALFLDDPSVTYADYYERALFNGILASQDPESGMMTYFQATRPGYVKLYCTPEDSFWCCTGSGMENHARYGDSIYFHDAGSLYVNLFIASELNWREKRLRVVQTTAFPDGASTTLTVHAARPVKFGLKVRHPEWCRRAAVSVNGRRYAESEKSASYIDIDRTWRDGDVVTVELPMRLRLQALPDAPDVAALMYGPIVLAARLGTEGLAAGADIIVNERTSGDMLNIPMELPKLAVSNQTLQEKVRRKADDSLVFSVNAMQPVRELELIPYYRIAHERYNLYWQLT